MLKSISRWLRADLTRIHITEREIAIKRVHLTTLLLAATIALIVGFTGGLFTGHYAWKPSQAQIRQSCPPERSQLGCVVKLYAQHAHAKPKDPVGPVFPDVSSWQGHPDWAAAQRSIDGAIVKAWEYSQDVDFTYNANELTRLHIRWGAYLFVRNCYSGPAFADAVKPWATHISVLVLDMEVPSANGCAPRLYSDVHRLLPKTPIVIYSAPGTWPGGSSAGLDAWVAAYGPAHVPCLFTCHVGPSSRQTILAWQMTDGVYGQVTYIPGIGRGDVSIDYGIFGTAPKPKPKPVVHRPVACTSSSQTARCRKLRAEVAGWQRALASSQRAATATAGAISRLQAEERLFQARVRYFTAKIAAAH